MGEDSLPGRDVRAACPAVVAGVGLDLGDEVVLGLGGDLLLAAPAGDAESRARPPRAGCVDGGRAVVVARGADLVAW